MDEPIPPIDNVFERTTAEIEALKAYKPKTDAERRRCAAELVRLERVRIDLAKQVISENAAAQIAEVIGHDYAKPTDPARMNGNGHAPQANWAQVIAEVELRFETKFAALKEEKSSGISDSDITAFAKGLVPYLNERLAEAVAPLQARLDELEARPVLTYEGVWNATKAYSRGAFCTFQGGLWHCEDTNVGAKPGSGSPCWKLAVKKGHADR